MFCVSVHRVVDHSIGHSEHLKVGADLDVLHVPPLELDDVVAPAASCL